MMMHFAQLPKPAVTLVGIWTYLLLLFAIALFITGLRDNKFRYRFLRNLFYGIVAAIVYVLFECMADFFDSDLTSESLRYVIRLTKDAPAAAVFGICLLATIGEGILLVSLMRWNRTHITAMSVKEAVDTLPAGICMLDEEGRVFLKNRTIEAISEQLLGESLQNGRVFLEALQKEEQKGGHCLLNTPQKVLWMLSDGSVRSFSEEKYSEQGGEIRILTASDVTEEYRKTQLLAEKKAKVSELNQKLTEYNKNIVSLITAQEVLDAKVKIHDEMGALLLSVRHYLTHEPDPQEKEDILRRLQQNLRFLRQESKEAPADEYTLMIDTAKKLGVNIRVFGELPQTEPNRHIVATAIHECFTNTLRHAGGDCLNICVEKQENELTVEFTNNGKPPESEVIKRGGLASLEELVNRENGSMEIESEPVFKLTLRLFDETTD